MTAFVDNSISDGTTASKTAVVFDSSQNVIAGNNLIVELRWEGGTSSPTVSDTAGNTYEPVDTAQLGATSGYVSLWYCLNCLGNASNVITVTHPVARTFNKGSASQFSSTNAMAFVSSEKASTSGTSITGAGLSASDDGLLIAGLGAFNFIATWTLGGDLANNRGGNLGYAYDGDVIFAGSGTKTAAFTVSSSTNLGMVAALFSDVAVGGVTQLGSLSLMGVGR